MAIFGTYSRDGRTIPTRRAPQTITLLSDLIVQEPAGQQRQCLDPQSAGPAGALVLISLFKPRALSTTYANDLAYSRLFKGCVLAYFFFRILDCQIEVQTSQTPSSSFHKLFCEIFRDLFTTWELIHDGGTYSRDGRMMPTRRAPQTIALLSDLIVQVHLY